MLCIQPLGDHVFINHCVIDRITIYKGMHPRADVDRLYVERSKGGKGLMNVENVVQYESQPGAEVVRLRSSPCNVYGRTGG